MKHSGYLFLLSMMTTAVTFGAFGCRPVDQDNPDALIVLVAASLSEPITELAERFEGVHGLAVYVRAGASGALRKPSEPGAPGGAPGSGLGAQGAAPNVPPRPPQAPAAGRGGC